MVQDSARLAGLLLEAMMAPLNVRTCEKNPPAISSCNEKCGWVTPHALPVFANGDDGRVFMVSGCRTGHERLL